MVIVRTTLSALQNTMSSASPTILKARFSSPLIVSVSGASMLVGSYLRKSWSMLHGAFGIAPSSSRRGKQEVSTIALPRHYPARANSMQIVRMAGACPKRLEMAAAPMR
jgi:hypothetical protein